MPRHILTVLSLLLSCSAVAQALDTKQTATYKRLKAQLDAIPAIDTHDHLWPFETLPGYVETERGHGMNLSSIWRNSYYTWFNPITKWHSGGKFDDWWRKAMWGADCNHAEGIYGATEFTRRCIAEVLAEKIDRGDLKEDHALGIGRQIFRDNALSLFPQLSSRLWKHKGKLNPP